MPGLVALNRTRVWALPSPTEVWSPRRRIWTANERLEIACAYLVGCDGGRSEIRRGIGATLHGDAVVQRVQSTLSGLLNCSA